MNQEGRELQHMRPVNADGNPVVADVDQGDANEVRRSWIKRFFDWVRGRPQRNANGNANDAENNQNGNANAQQPVAAQKSWIKRFFDWVRGRPQRNANGNANDAENNQNGNANAQQPVAARKSWIKRFFDWVRGRPQRNANGNANDEEAAFVDVEVKIHGEILDFKYKRMQIIWNSHLNSMLTKNSKFKENFLIMTKDFHTTVFDSVGKLVSDHKTIMNGAQAMAKGEPDLDLRPESLIDNYFEVRNRINFFGTIEFDSPDASLKDSCNKVRDKILAEFNEDTQLLVYYLELVPLMWEMAKQARTLYLGLAFQITGAFLGLLAFVPPLVDAIEVKELAAPTVVSATPIFQSLQYIAQDPTFQKHFVVPWELWSSLLKFKLCFCSVCILMLIIWLVSIFVIPNYFRWLNNSPYRGKRRAFKRRGEIRKTIGVAWPSDISENDFKRVSTVDDELPKLEHGSDEEEVFERRAAKKQINICTVKIPVEHIIVDPPVVAIGRRLQQEERQAA
ncbi:hypothetical protein PUMCH_000592 [Australozyma saopauloensis]|uniref:Uncharacterized protein n=1 Tax=Australozyma saopauloensis TaxID=291208 RepID=A0AAX4H4V5_9ASCO|nr:hypothetical protein PUMCH_000592 [[Candida] saopauloensis]